MFAAQLAQRMRPAPEACGIHHQIDPRAIHQARRLPRQWSSRSRQMGTVNRSLTCASLRLRWPRRKFRIIAAPPERQSRPGLVNQSRTNVVN